MIKPGGIYVTNPLCLLKKHNQTPVLEPSDSHKKAVCTNGDALPLVIKPGEIYAMKIYPYLLRKHNRTPVPKHHRKESLPHRLPPF
ncbi:hypothetical protein XENTR_v10023794 [Xenopus tropicalis]|nr:hypothetical protein XENTR_v10023794 [Xenopus tropicalis]